MKSTVLAYELIGRAARQVVEHTNQSLDLLHEARRALRSSGDGRRAGLLERLAGVLPLLPDLEAEALLTSDNGIRCASSLLARLASGSDEQLDAIEGELDLLMETAWEPAIEALDVLRDEPIDEEPAPPPAAPELGAGDLLALLRGAPINTPAEPLPGPATSPAVSTPRPVASVPPPVSEPVAAPSQGANRSRPASPAPETATPPSAQVDPLSVLQGPGVDEEAATLRGSVAPDVLEAFLGESTELVDRLMRAADPSSGKLASRARDLARTCHTLKGVSASLGLHRIAEGVHRLESGLDPALAPSDTWIQRHVDALAEAFERVRRVLTASAQKAPASVSRPDPAPKAVEPVPPEQELATAFDGVYRVGAERLGKMLDLASELLAQAVRQKAELAELAVMLETSIGPARLVASRTEAAPEAAPQRPAVDREARVRSRKLLAAMRDAREEQAALARRLWSELEEASLVPVSGLFQRLARAARDAARVEGRSIEIIEQGRETLADRVLMDTAYEGLIHLVRNAVSHGIESPDSRRACGKPESGRLTLSARRESNVLCIRVDDDGRGLDGSAVVAKGIQLGLVAPGTTPTPELVEQLVFRPGFSTRDQANAVSGRGVGLDVVADMVAKRRGSIRLSSTPGVGTRFELRFPSRLAYRPVVVVRAGGRPLGLALDAVESADDPEHDAEMPLPVDLARALGIESSPSECPKLLLIRSTAGRFLVSVDAIDGPSELMIRPLPSLLAGHPLVTGFGMIPGGESVPILDPEGLRRRAPAPGPALLAEPVAVA